MVDYSHLENYLSDEVECFVFDSIPSTNNYLSSLAFSLKTQVCIAAQQTQGKGQHNRAWLSSKGGSILLSIRRVFLVGVNLNGLSLVVGLALIEVLKDYGITDLQLKWPNDVYYQDRKLAGILIENAVRNQTQSVIIGLGINIDADINCQTPWTNLHSISKQKPINKFSLTTGLINKILQLCQIFETNGFAYFAQQWASVDYLQGRRVQYDDKKQIFSGVCCGVNNEGVLLVETQYGAKLVYSSESLSLC
ncbi:Biotin--protein ligase, / Biotin operon repressor [uncultured Candidatus Thioglobus sp.]|nr:Biotin--protein ligase, / Biotin operon repressor [uncultured Candidatus Thioglobus sp.]